MREESMFADRETARFAQAQAGRVGHGDEDAIAQSLRRIDDTQHLLGRENDRQMTLPTHERNPLDHLLAFEDLGVEEAESAHHLIEEAEGSVTLIAKVKLIGEDLVGTERVGRSMEECRELRDRVEVGLLCALRVVANPHEVVHALTKG
jgi:hypothetical protein